MSIATAFQGANKALAIETRLATLGLYRWLIRATKPYQQHSHVMRKEIREQFRKNQYNTSRPRVLNQLEHAANTLDVLERGHNEKELKSKILSYVNKHCIPKWKKRENSLKPPEKKKKKKHTKRKPYQVALTVKTASGYTFKRVRGWRQPVQTAMMLKNRVKKSQERVDRWNELKDQLSMIEGEKKFLNHLRCLPKDQLSGFEKTIKMAIGINNKYKKNFDSKVAVMEEKDNFSSKK